MPLPSLTHANVAVLLDGSVGRIPLPAMTAGAELRRHAALVQQHSARGTDTASHAVWGAGVVGTRAVTGEKAGTRDIDKVTGAECPLGATTLSRAIPEAPLLADTVVTVLCGDTARCIALSSKLAGAQAGGHTLALGVPEQSWRAVTTRHTAPQLLTVFWLPTVLTTHWGTLLVLLAGGTRDRAQCLGPPERQRTLPGTATSKGSKHRAQAVLARSTATHGRQAAQVERLPVDQPLAFLEGWAMQDGTRCFCKNAALSVGAAGEK